MKRFVEGVARGQGTLFPECLDDWIDEDNPVRAIDVFVDALDLAGLGFDRVDQADALARKAVALDENDSNCQTALSWVHQLRRSYELAEHHCIKALELNRNSAMALTNLGDLYISMALAGGGPRTLRRAPV